MVKRSLVSLFVLLAVAGCSQFKFVYALGGEAIRSEAEFYLDLTEDEELALAENVDALVLWHRTAMLPRYAAFLRSTADRVEKGALRAPVVEEMIVRMRSLLEETVKGAAPIVAKVLADHTAPQKVAYLRERVAERLSERRVEAEASRDDWVAERTERAIDRFERFFGDVTSGQKKTVRRYFEGISDLPPHWQKMREFRHQAFVDFLAERPNHERIAAFLPRILLRSGDIVGPAYTRLADAWWDGFTAWMIEMATSMTPAQRVHFTRTLRDYADDMVDLST